MDRIVVTGIGMITPLGLRREACWEKIARGDSLLQEPVPAGLPMEFLPHVRSAPFQGPANLHRAFPLALSAVQEALSHAGLDLSSRDGESVGCSVSVSKPLLPDALPDLRGKNPVKEIPAAPETVLERIRGHYKISGPAVNVVAACATGVHSLLTASRWLWERRCDVAIAGSVESSLHPLYLAGFQQLGVLSDYPCPFDKRRNGFMIGEGAGVLVLEREEDARKRFVPLLAELAGTAVGSDAHHPTSFMPDGSSIAAVLRRALACACTSPDAVDYVNLHGTGTVVNDQVETRALKKVFGAGAETLSLSSTKAATGHLLGAAGSVEAAVACLALRDQFAPPTANLEEPDEDCGLDYTPLRGLEKKIETAVSLSFGFGGSIGAAVFKKI